MDKPETIVITVNGQPVVINKADLPLWTDKIGQKPEPKPKEPKAK